jgi:hypothetical protein
VLLGRERECSVIDRLLQDAGAGLDSALVVRGEAGIGKSALLEYARQRVAGDPDVPADDPLRGTRTCRGYRPVTTMANHAAITVKNAAMSRKNSTP